MSQLLTKILLCLLGAVPLLLTKLSNEKHCILYCERNLDFPKFPRLMKLQEKNKLLISENYINDKSCRLFVTWLANTLKSRCKMIFTKLVLYLF